MYIEKINALFELIDFINIKMDGYNIYHANIDTANKIKEQLGAIGKVNTHAQKTKQNELNELLKNELAPLNDNVINPIYSKARELNIYENDLMGFEKLLVQISYFNETYNNEIEVNTIIEYKDKYLKIVENDYMKYLFKLEFFKSLHEAVHNLFNYFIESEDEKIKDVTKENLINDNGFRTHENLYRSVILSVNTENQLPIDGAYYLIKETWFFINSDIAFFNGNKIPKIFRPLKVCPITNNPVNFDEYLNADIEYCGKQNNIQLIEIDFINDITHWIKNELNQNYKIAEKRKFKEFLDYLEIKQKNIEPTINKENLQPQQVDKTNSVIFKVGLLFAKGEVNKYIDVNAKGETIIKQGYSAPKIANELGDINYNKYILASINNYSTEKNIFNRPDTMRLIIEHCEAENITVDPYFTSRLKTK